MSNIFSNQVGISGFSGDLIYPGKVVRMYSFSSILKQVGRVLWTRKCHQTFHRHEQRMITSRFLGELFLQQQPDHVFHPNMKSCSDRGMPGRKKGLFEAVHTRACDDVSLDCICESWCNEHKLIFSPEIVTHSGNLDHFPL